MNINPQQNRPNPGQPWMPTGQGQNFGYQPGQQSNQFMQPNPPMGPPKSSAAGPPMMQTVPMFSAQNGNATPPSSLNPAISNPQPQSNVMKQPQMDQVIFRYRNAIFSFEDFIPYSFQSFYCRNRINHFCI